MKKALQMVILTLLGMAQVVAQEEEGYLPIVREGVTWVNEKVIVSNGDTTRYFYKYEFSGHDTAAWHNNNACYYYTGEHLDVESDSLIAGLLEGYYGNFVTCFRNHAYSKSWQDGRRMLLFDALKDGGTTLLYIFKNHKCDDYYMEITEHGISYGIAPFLTSENFKEIDPITIEGVECERYAYLGEKGDTLALLVEGIGFDSRNLGDLLTPFTSPPDPNNDYQEWWGLSHVIKDGEIIYKGMRYGYHEGQPEETDNDNDASQDPNYYDPTGRCFGTEVPTAQGVYIHKRKKIFIH